MKKTSQTIYLLICLFAWFASAAQGKVELDTAQLRLLNQHQEVDKLISQFQFEKALILLYKQLETLRNDADIRSNIAYCHLKLGRLHRAKYYYQQLITDNPKDLHALAQLATIYSKEQNHREAMRCYEWLIQADNSNSFYYKQAAALALMNKDTSRAYFYYQQSNQLNPEDSEAAIELADLHFYYKQKEASQSLLEKSLHLDSTNISLIKSAARLFFLQDRYDRSISLCKKALQLKDTSQFTLRLLGLGHYFKREFEQAAPHLEQLLKTVKDESTLYYYVGVCYLVQKKYAQSVTFFQAAIKAGISENTHEYYKQLGAASEKLDERKAAINAYKKALDYGETRTIYYQLGRLSELQYKDKNIALKYYEQFLQTKGEAQPDLEQYALSRTKDLKALLFMKN